MCKISTNTGPGQLGTALVPTAAAAGVALLLLQAEDADTDLGVQHHCTHDLCVLHSPPEVVQSLLHADTNS